ncbi:hypothetical protein [Rhodocaloribacter sp.]
MKAQITKLTDTELSQSYPIKGEVTGWYYRITETSNNAWLIEGSDHWGRKILIRGDDPDNLIEQAEKEARNINENKNT